PNSPVQRRRSTPRTWRLTCADAAPAVAVRARRPNPIRRDLMAEKSSQQKMKTYPEGTTFSGRISRTWRDSEPAFPLKPKAPKGPRNLLYVVRDVAAFGGSAPFGGRVEPPNTPRLADNGLRYTNFHTTALCSPTRSCLITGRNHHSNAMGCITEMATG